MLIFIAVSLLASLATFGQVVTSEPCLKQRGYYFTFMRMPTYDLHAWKRIVDNVHEDGGNTIILWVAGGFKSKLYPITWRYNQEHQNIQKDFLADLIHHAHSRKIKVLLGFTPFGYDGVNQLALEKPGLKALDKQQKPVTMFGIGCWGYNLCPSQAMSQSFMFNYIREMMNYYPDADGLFIESSDYAACHCPKCGNDFFAREFEFVQAISKEQWRRKPEAQIIIYPHYFSGSKVPGFDINAARMPLDSRWTLFFTPHSAQIDAELVRKSKASIWWDDAPALRGPLQIKEGVLKAQSAGMTGYIPSFESFTFKSLMADEGQEWLKGRRQTPFGFAWLDPGMPAYEELPIVIQRIAYREFSRNPNLSMDGFKHILGSALFGEKSNPNLVEDALLLQQIFTQERTWCQPSLVASPDRVAALKKSGALTQRQTQILSTQLEQMKNFSDKYEGTSDKVCQQIERISNWVLDQWKDRKELLLNSNKN